MRSGVLQMPGPVLSWMHIPRDLPTALGQRDREVVGCLEVEPELRRGAEIAAEPDGGIG